LITPAQCCEARKLLGWSSERLGPRCGTSHTSIRLFEDNFRPLSPERLAALREVLEQAGVEFIAENGGGLTVRMRKASNV
jgi:hypothetical protein